MCADTDCAQVDVHDLGPSFTWFTPLITIGPDQLPVLVYQDFEPEGTPVRLAICTDPACVESAITALDVPGLAAGPFSLALDPTGLWAAAYPVSNGEFRLARCADQACSDVTVSVFDDTGTDDEGPARIVFGPEGLPVIAYSPAGELKLAACLDPACSQATVTSLASHPSVMVRSLIVGQDGNSIVSYRAEGAEWLAMCETAKCDQFRIAPVQGIPDGGLMSVVAGADGLPLFVYQTETLPVGDPEMGQMTGNLVVAKCVDPACLES
jgi:hypothetical protein